jgi:hypothetical protein
MLAATNGRFIALSTPAGKRGWFYQAWNSEGAGWEKVQVKADQCSRISKEFLAEELETHGPLLYSQEYNCAFIDPTTSVFQTELIEAAMVDDFEPFLPPASVIPEAAGA